MCRQSAAATRFCMHLTSPRERTLDFNFGLCLLASGIDMARNESTLHKLKQDAMALWEERFHIEREYSRLHRFLHFWVLVGKSFNRNRCPIRASALSFTTLLALIPMLAVAISITSAFLKNQGEDEIYRFVDQVVSAMVPAAPMTNPSPAGITATNSESEFRKTNSLGEAEALSGRPNTPAETAIETNAVEAERGSTNVPPPGETNQSRAAVSADTNAPANPDRAATQKEAAKRIHEFVRNTRSGTIGTVGAVLLVLVGIRMLRSVESTFNDIWGVTRGRNWLNTIQIYCTLLLIGPLLLAGAAGPHLESTQRFLATMPVLGPLLFPVLTLLMLWLLFTLFYQFMPNTRVRFKAALVGGIVGGTVWHVNNLFGFLYVSRVVSNSKIYGSLGLIPVFMLGVYFSWLFVLFGAQVSYAFQNRKLYLQERLTENVNQRGREFVALRLMTCIGQRFQRGQRAATIEQMSDELGIPSRLVHQVMQTLIAAHLAIEIAGAESAYTPSRPLDQINAHHILQAMRARGQELLTRDEPVREEVYGEFARIQEAEKHAASSITMLALVNRADARLELAPPLQSEQIEISPALVPPQKTQPEPAPPSKPEPTPHVEILKSVESAKPETPIISQTHRPDATESISDIKPLSTESLTSPKPPIVEPVPDEERDFPL